jgi:hypothetical protein
MSNVNKRVLVLFWLAGGLVTSTLFVGCWVWQLGQHHGGAAGPDMADWDVPRLVGRLHDNGVDLHMTSPYKGKPVADAAYLSDSERSWEELNRLPATRDSVGRWRGVVYCEKVGPRPAKDVRVALWGDACLVAPPFLFFGDRDLLDRIGGALHADERRA